MSEKHMEELRRICLICGCHTNQIINVFEPRNGPNIVELIRAKFKFQPVNDDKYLCYSCNNWLINWHSLKNLNKDSVEDQSDKPRSRVNECLPEEGARVSNSSSIYRSNEPSQVSAAMPSSTHRSQKRKGFYFPKRPPLNPFRIGKSKGKSHACFMCGLSLRKKPGRTSSMQKPMHNEICKICSRAKKNRTSALKRTKCSIWRRCWAPSSVTRSNLRDRFRDIATFSREQLPTIDGRLVAKLQRLGTTLAWESDSAAFNPLAARERHGTFRSVKYDTRKKTNERDEVLINFDQVLSEVFPLQHAGMGSVMTRSQTTTVGPLNHKSEVTAMEHDSLLLESLCCKLPQGITVSIVEGERGSD